jgi:hypothetical protein
MLFPYMVCLTMANEIRYYFCHLLDFRHSDTLVCSESSVRLPVFALATFVWFKVSASVRFKVSASVRFKEFASVRLKVSASVFGSDLVCFWFYTLIRNVSKLGLNQDCFFKASPSQTPLGPYNLQAAIPGPA